MIALRDFQVTGVPDAAFYIPNFITEEEEKRLLSRIDQTPQVRWTQLSNRRLQNWGGIPHSNGMIPEDIPPWLQTAVDKVNFAGVFDLDCTDCDESKGTTAVKANHVLLNEYKPGEGIMPHLDGDLFYPTISTVSLQSHTVLNFYDKAPLSAPLEHRLKFGFLLEPRSLLVLKDEMYKDFMHGIDEVMEDDVTVTFPNLTGDEVKMELSEKKKVLQRGTRVSLTIRNVPNVKKFRLKLGK